MLLLGVVDRSCDWMDGGMVPLGDIAGDATGGPACQAVTAGSYWIAKGTNRDAQDGHWTVGEMCCGGRYAYCGRALYRGCCEGPYG